MELGASIGVSQEEEEKKSEQLGGSIRRDTIGGATTRCWKSVEPPIRCTEKSKEANEAQSVSVGSERHQAAGDPERADWGHWRSGRADWGSTDLLVGEVHQCGRLALRLLVEKDVDACAPCHRHHHVQIADVQPHCCHRFLSRLLRHFPDRLSPFPTPAPSPPFAFLRVRDGSLANVPEALHFSHERRGEDAFSLSP